MTLFQATPSTDTRPDPVFWSRLDTATAFADFSDPLGRPCSQRDYAQQHGIPRSTLGYWLRQDFPDHLDPDLVWFFRCPAGHAFLRRLVLALLLIFHHKNACGLRQIGSFLEQVELDSFVGSSYGALYDLDLWLQDNLGLFAQHERQRLIPGMAPKDIVLCPDENFHGPHVCLVAIEPVSNFILVETYRDRRDSTTWVEAIRAGSNDLPVNIVLLTSDQASGLVRCAETELQVAHQPDLLHLQHDLAKPILLPLARPIHQAVKDLEKAKQQEERLEAAEEKEPGSVTIERFVAHLHAEKQTQKELDEARQRREKALEQIRAVSRVYHPFDPETGQPVTAEQMQQRLEEPIQGLQKVIEEAGLSEQAHEAVGKARKWVVLLVGCIGWFWTMTRQRLEKLDRSEEAQRVIQECLIAGCYWEMASIKEKDPEKRKRQARLARQLKEKAWAKGSVLAGWSQAEKEEIERVARQCAELFQRSSSCVEGRNGRLSLFHHGQTRLSKKRLEALTAIHNYVVRREDGSTAAERFFGQKQRDAFNWLLDKMPDLPYPAAKRRKQPSDERPAVA
jgi:Family of unknown function (DUF6399)